MVRSCFSCKNNIGTRAKVLQCAKCQKWFHTNCIHDLTMDEKSYFVDEAKKNGGDRWICVNCSPCVPPPAPLPDSPEFIRAVSNLQRASLDFGQSALGSISSARRESLLPFTNASLIDRDTIKDIIKEVFKEELLSMFRQEMQSVMLSLNNELTLLKERVELLENTNQTPNFTLPNSLINENINEMEERKSKEGNVMVFNLPENSGTDEEKKNKDITNIKNIVNVEIDTNEVKLFRIGKPNNKPRPVKLCFKNKSAAVAFLKACKTIDTGAIRFGNDLTKMQREHIQSLRSELKRRKDLGEEDITIKYFNGVPKITKTQYNQKN